MKNLLLAASLIFAALSFGAGSADAYGRGGPGYHGGYYRGGYYGGFYGGPYWYGGIGLTVPLYPYYYGAPPAEVYAPPAVVVPGAAPAPSTPTPAAATGAANIRVLVPDAQATVQIDGTTTRSTGTDRVFQTPPLSPGTAYKYTIRAIWTQGGRQVSSEQTVPVSPGQTTVLDFNPRSSEKLAPPPAPGDPKPY